MGELMQSVQALAAQSNVSPEALLAAAQQLQQQQQLQQNMSVALSNQASQALPNNAGYPSISSSASANVGLGGVSNITSGMGGLAVSPPQNAFSASAAGTTSKTGFEALDPLALMGHESGVQASQPVPTNNPAAGNADAFADI